MRVVIYDEAVEPEVIAEELNDDSIVVLNLVRPEARRLQHETAQLFPEGRVPVQLEDIFGADMDDTFGWIHFLVRQDMYSLYRHEGIHALIMKALIRKRRDGDKKLIFATSVY
jgi:hypothetical protein